MGKEVIPAGTYEPLQINVSQWQSQEKEKEKKDIMHSQDSLNSESKHECAHTHTP